MILNFKDFEQMEEIDQQYFPDENITSAKEAYEWYLSDQNSFIVIKERNKVLGYVNILSLKKNIFDKIKNNIINESSIKVKDLELSKNKYFNYLYFASIAIDKEHRNINSPMKLLRATQKWLAGIISKNKIIEVMADCSTKEGTKITQKFLRLKPYIKTSHNSTIHISNGETFIQTFLSL